MTKLNVFILKQNEELYIKNVECVRFILRSKLTIFKLYNIILKIKIVLDFKTLFYT